VVRVPLPRVDGRAVRWDEHRAERRRHVLDAAIAAIEAAPPGAELNLQQIADASGVVRTVLYRHFDGRLGLQRELRGHIVSMIAEAVIGSITLEGSIDEIIDRALHGYIDWVAGHPRLYVWGERELGDGQESQLQELVQSIADQISAVVIIAAELLGRELDDEERAAVELLTFGIIGQVRGTVSSWIRRTVRTPDVDTLVTMLARSMWLQIDDQARIFGFDLDPTVPVADLFAATGSAEG
jgi:AcrR family transcriptional regulator